MGSQEEENIIILIIGLVQVVICVFNLFILYKAQFKPYRFEYFLSKCIPNNPCRCIVGYLGKLSLVLPYGVSLLAGYMAYAASHIHNHVAGGIAFFPLVIYSVTLSLTQWRSTKYNFTSYNMVLLLTGAICLLCYFAIALYYTSPYSYSSSASIYFIINYGCITGVIYHNYTHKYLDTHALLRTFRTSMGRYISTRGGQESSQSGDEDGDEGALEVVSDGREETLKGLEKLQFRGVLNDTCVGERAKGRAMLLFYLGLALLVLILFAISEWVMEDEEYKGIGIITSLIIISFDIITLTWSRITKIGENFLSPLKVCIILLIMRCSIIYFLKYWIYGHAIAYIFLASFILYYIAKSLIITPNVFTTNHRLTASLFYIIATLVYLIDTAIAYFNFEQFESTKFHGIEQYKFGLIGVIFPLIFFSGSMICLTYKNKYHFIGKNLYAFTSFFGALWILLGICLYYTVKQASIDTAELLLLISIFAPVIFLTLYVLINRWLINDVRFFVFEEQMRQVNRKIKLSYQGEIGVEVNLYEASNVSTLVIYFAFVGLVLLFGILCTFVFGGRGFYGFTASLWILIIFCLFVSFYGYTRTFYQLRKTILAHGMFGFLIVITWEICVYYWWEKRSKYILLISGISAGFMGLAFLIVALMAFKDARYKLIRRVIVLFIISILFDIVSIILMGSGYGISFLITFIVVSLFILILFMKWRTNNYSLPDAWKVALYIFIGFLLVIAVVIFAFEPTADTFLILWSGILILALVCVGIMAIVLFHKQMQDNNLTLISSKHLFPIFTYDSTNRGMKTAHEVVSLIIIFIKIVILWGLGASFSVEEKWRYIPLSVAALACGINIIFLRQSTFHSRNVILQQVRDHIDVKTIIRIYKNAFGPLLGIKSTFMKKRITSKKIKEEVDLDDEINTLKAMFRRENKIRDQKASSILEMGEKRIVSVKSIKQEGNGDYSHFQKGVDPKIRHLATLFQSEYVWDNRDFHLNKCKAGFHYHLSNEFYLIELNQKLKPLYVSKRRNAISRLPTYKSIFSMIAVAKRMRANRSPNASRRSSKPHSPKSRDTSPHRRGQSTDEKKMREREKEEARKIKLMEKEKKRKKEEERRNKLREDEKKAKKAEEAALKKAKQIENEKKKAAEDAKRKAKILSKKKKEDVESDEDEESVSSEDQRVNTPNRSRTTKKNQRGQSKKMRTIINRYGKDERNEWKEDPDRMTNDVYIYKDAQFRNLINYRDAVWNRADKVNPPDYDVEVFCGGAAHDDIRQGVLGDCWLISSMIITAVCRPKYIFKLFHPYCREIRNKGDYLLRFFINGKRKEIQIDDSFPCDRNGNPKFCKVSINHEEKIKEIWPMLVEKGMAKAYGGYERLDGGSIDSGLMDITGGAAVRFDLEDEISGSMIADGSMWKILTQFAESGYLLGAASHAGSDSDTSTSGIVQGHAYAILDVIQLDGKRLIQMKNPWGEVEWNGDWSDDSPTWNTKIKKNIMNIQHDRKLNIAKLDKSKAEDIIENEIISKDDGVFWMSLDDFVRHFSILSACRFFEEDDWIEIAEVYDEWNEGRNGGCTESIKTVKNNPHYRLTNHSRKKLTLFLMVQQLKEAMADGFELYKDEKRRIGDPKVGYPVAENWGSYQEERQISRELALEPGSYLLLITTYHPNLWGRFRVTVHARTRAKEEITFKRFY